MGDNIDLNIENYDLSDLLNLFNLRQPNKAYYIKHPQLQKIDNMFKDMLDLNYVLQHNCYGFQDLPSSKKIFQS